jgi:hypothetical protein
MRMGTAQKLYEIDTCRDYARVVSVLAVPDSSSPPSSPPSNSLFGQSRYVFQEFSGAKYHTEITCKTKFCRRCEDARSARLIRRYTEIHSQTRMGALKHLVLTSRPVEMSGEWESEPLRAAERRFRRAVSEFLRKTGFDGAGFVSDEYTLSPAPSGVSVYLHAHVVGVFPFREQGSLSLEWERITGNSIVWINKVKDDVEALKYGLKGISYALKGGKEEKAPSERGKIDLIAHFKAISPESKTAMIRHFHGRRWVRNFGGWYNIGRVRRRFADTSGKTALILVSSYGQGEKITAKTKQEIETESGLRLEKIGNALHGETPAIREIREFLRKEDRFAESLTRIETRKLLETAEMRERKRAYRERNIWKQARTGRFLVLEEELKGLQRERTRARILVQAAKKQSFDEIQIKKALSKINCLTKIIFYGMIWKESEKVKRKVAVAASF